MKHIDNLKVENSKQENMTRKQLKKMGKYGVLMAIRTFLMLNPLKSQAHSSPPNPGGEFFYYNYTSRNL